MDRMGFGENEAIAWTLRTNHVNSNHVDSKQVTRTEWTGSHFNPLSATGWDDQATAAFVNSQRQVHMNKFTGAKARGQRRSGKSAVARAQWQRRRAKAK